LEEIIMQAWRTLPLFETLFRVALVPIPDDVVLCDVCGDPIDPPMMMLLVLDGYVWGIICEECRRKYHHDKQLLLWNEYEENMLRIGEIP